MSVASRGSEACKDEDVCTMPYTGVRTMRKKQKMADTATVMGTGKQWWSAIIRLTPAGPTPTTSPSQNPHALPTLTTTAPAESRQTPVTHLDQPAFVRSRGKNWGCPWAATPKTKAVPRIFDWAGHRPMAVGLRLMAISHQPMPVGRGPMGTFF